MRRSGIKKRRAVAAVRFAAALFVIGFVFVSFAGCDTESGGDNEDSVSEADDSANGGVDTGDETEGDGEDADDGEENGDTDTTPPEGTVAEEPELLLSDETIVVWFDESMDTGSLVLGGLMAPESDGGVWSRTLVEDDTLTIAPMDEWGVGEGRTLTVDAADSAGNSAERVGLEFSVFNAILYVSTPENGGDDENQGTADAPLASVGTAAGLIEGLERTMVMVSAGTYDENGITLPDGLLLYGGYSPDDWSIWDPVAYETVLQDTGTGTTGEEFSPNRVLYAGADVTESTVVRGFTIRGGEGTLNAFYTSVFVEGGSPVIRECELYGGVTAPNGTFYGLLVTESGSPLIENCTVGGDGAGSGSYSYGVRIDGSSPVIRYCDIDGGSGNFAKWGIYATSSSEPLIVANTIDADGRGIATENGSAVIRNNVIGSGTAAYGISEAGSSSVIQNNTILGGNAGIHMSLESSPTIVNNIVFLSTTTYCINAVNEDPLSEPAMVRNNNLDGWVVYLEGSTQHFGVNGTVTTGEGTEELSTWGNVEEDSLFEDEIGGDEEIRDMDDNDWHLTDESPAAVREGGMDLSGDFTTDRDGNPRTAPWSMGAYEKD